MYHLINLFVCTRDLEETDGNSNYKSYELSELNQGQFIENVHITFNLEAGLLLPFVLKYNIYFVYLIK